VTELGLRGRLGGKCGQLVSGSSVVTASVAELNLIFS